MISSSPSYSLAVLAMLILMLAQGKVYYDQEGNTLTVWFGNPTDEYIAEETGEEVIILKGKNGSVIGFEKLNFCVSESSRLNVALETVAV